MLSINLRDRALLPWLFAAASFALASCAPTAQVPTSRTDDAAAPWIRVATPHFDIIGQVDASAIELYQVALEEARSTILATAFDGNVSSLGRISVIIPNRAAHYSGWEGPTETITLASRPPYLRKQIVILANREQIETQSKNGAATNRLRTLRAAVVDAVMEAYLPKAPLWLSAGMEGYYETMVLDRARGMAVLGAGSAAYEQYRSEDTTLSDLFSWKGEYSPDYWRLFAGSTALYRILVTRHPAELRNFMARLHVAEPWGRAWDATFDRSAGSTLASELNEFWNARDSDRLSVRVATSTGSVSPQITAAAEADVHLAKAFLYRYWNTSRASEERRRLAANEVALAFRADPASDRALAASVRVLGERPSEATVRNVYAAHPHDPTTAIAMSTLMDLKSPEAPRVIEEALLADPNHPQLLAAWAFMCEERGDQEGALIAARRAFHSSPDDASIVLQYLIFLSRNHRCDESAVTQAKIALSSRESALSPGDDQGGLLRRVLSLQEPRCRAGNASQPASDSTSASPAYSPEDTVIAKNRFRFKECYNRALSRDLSSGGAIHVRVTVGPTGVVRSAAIASTTASQDLSECIRLSFLEMKFPPQDEESKQFTVPVVLSAKH
ncbi:MAG: hypothetical protein NVS3B20_05090 [Polyangiales bacterium]